jgi:hypothetical protein
VSLRDTVSDTVAQDVSVKLEPMEADGTTEREGRTEDEVETLRDGLALPEEEGVTGADRETLGETLGEALTGADGETLGEALTEWDAKGEAEARGEVLRVAVAVRDRERVGGAVGDDEVLAHCDSKVVALGKPVMVPSALEGDPVIVGVPVEVGDCVASAAGGVPLGTLTEAEELRVCA